MALLPLNFLTKYWDKNVIKKVIDAFITQTKLKQLVV